MKKFNFKRKGTFTLSRQMLMEDPEVVMKMLGDVLIIRAENCFVEDNIIYYGYSEHFDEVPEGSISPVYQCVVTSDDNSFSFDWIRNDLESFS